MELNNHMIYLEVANTNDDDVTLFKFDDIIVCARFIQDNELCEYVIMDEVVMDSNNSYPKDDYEYIPNMQINEVND
ncbi:MAG: hypothetical protein WB562_13460 [Candidatus Sulfotelmatobacter sp.]